MKKTIVYLFCIVLSIAMLQAQIPGMEMRRNPDGSFSRGRLENGLQEGLWISYDANNSIKRLQEFKNGKPHGWFIENDEHGHPQTEGFYWEGKPVGKHISSNHGKLISETDYDAGTSSAYYDNGQIRKTESLKNGLRNGKSTTYYENGNLLSENFYVEDKKNGVQKYYYQSGVLQAEYMVGMDVLNGEYKEYYPNGKIASEGRYENNMKEGTWKEYDESGKLLKQRKYKNDLEVR